MRPTPRTGVVLLALLGVSLLLIGLVFSITLKVYRSKSDSLSLQKYAQAFAMAQAARVYLHDAWLDMSPTAQTLKSAKRDPAGFVFVHQAGATTRVYNFTYTADSFGPDTTQGIFTTANFAATGWFAFIPDAGRFLVLAAGGPSYATGTANPKLAAYDTRLYLSYDPVADVFTGGPYPNSSWASVTAPWARMATP